MYLEGGLNAKLKLQDNIKKKEKEDNLNEGDKGFKRKNCLGHLILEVIKHKKQTLMLYYFK